MLVAMSPSRACTAYAIAPTAMDASRNAIQAQYPRFPRTTSRPQPLRNSLTPDMAASGRVEVVELRVRGELLLEDEHPLGLHHLADLALRVEEVAELPRADRADLDARRVAPAARPLDAEGALLDDALRARAVAEV